MSRLQSLKPHHLLLGAIAAILIWLVGCGGQLPASLGGGTLGTPTEPGGGGAPAPSCAAAPAVPNASTADSPHLVRHSGGCPGDGSGSHHGHSTHRHGSHSHSHGHGHRHHFDDDREHTSSSRQCDCDRAHHAPASHDLASVRRHSAPTTAAA
jgi:hypothetical protein